MFAASQAPGKEHELKGSGRSIPGFHLRDALDLVAKRAPGAIVRFGGHAMAAGFSIWRASLKDFETLFAKAVSRLADPEQLQPVIWTDGSLEPSWLRQDWIQSIHDLGTLSRGKRSASIKESALTSSLDAMVGRQINMACRLSSS